MRTTVVLDDRLLGEAQRLTGTTERTALLREALQALIERESARRLARMGASQPDAQVSPPPAGHACVILVDTSIWIDHLRFGDARLERLLLDGRVLMHPWVVGEVALGRLSERTELLGLLGQLPRADVASDSEVLALVETRGLAGAGIGWVDAHLLAATMLTQDARLWSRDRRLAAAAGGLGVADDEGPAAG